MRSGVQTDHTRELYWPYPFFSAFHFTVLFISHISVLSFPVLFIPSLIYPNSACSPVFARLYSDHLLIFTLSTPPPPSSSFLLLLLILLLLHPHPNPSPSFFFPQRLYFFFLASNPFSPSHPPLFHYSLLILSATIPVFHICCSTYSFSKSYFYNSILLLLLQLNFSIFYLNFSPPSLRHLFLLYFFSLPVNPISDSGVLHYWLC